MRVYVLQEPLAVSRLPLLSVLYYLLVHHITCNTSTQLQFMATVLVVSKSLNAAIGKLYVIYFLLSYPCSGVDCSRINYFHDSSLSANSARGGHRSLILIGFFQACALNGKS